MHTNSNMNRVVDKHTVIKLKRGNLEAFRSVYNMFATRIFHFCNKLLPQKKDAEDIVQKTFMALWEQRAQLDENKDILKYLYAIARNNVYQYLRKYFAEQEILVDSNEKYEISQNSTDEYMDFTESNFVISRIIEKLPPKRKEIFKLNRINGLTYREIADKLNISENTVDTQMRKSLKFLKEQYKLYFNK